MKTRITQEQINAVVIMLIRVSIGLAPFGVYKICELVGALV